MLKLSPVLVVEDEPFIALDLAMAIEDIGGQVIGPAASVAEALALLEHQTVAGAILDVNLTDGDVSPVVDLLVARHVPMIIQSGVGLPPELALRFPDLVVRIKPTVSAVLVAELDALINAWKPAP